MKSNDSLLLEKAYLSINQKVPSVPSDEIHSPEAISEPKEDSAEDETQEEMAPETEESEETEISEVPETPAKISLSDLFSQEDNSDHNEEIHDMNVDNLNSIRESILKIAMFCGNGQQLEPWQQQKIAIAMDNLGEVARRLH